MARGAMSVLMEGMSGRAGTVVFVQTRRGVVVRGRPRTRNPQTAAQQTARMNLTRASVAFKQMEPEFVTLWRQYAGERGTSAVAAFTGLGTRFLQLWPGGALPQTPPLAAFGGDSIAVAAAGGAGAVMFLASGGNAPGVTTELLLNALVSRNRTPEARAYRHKAFRAFGQDLTAAVAATPGWYVPAYRFVNTATGQDVGLVILPTVQVT